MIDLATMFDEMGADLGAPVSGFPVSGKTEPERQASVNKEISGISGISGGSKLPAQKQNSGRPQACAQGRGGVRARGAYSPSPETPETPEKSASSDTCFSGSPSRNPEKERETGKVAALRATPGRSAPDPAAFDERAAFLEYECGMPRAEAEAQARSEIGPIGAALSPVEELVSEWRDALTRIDFDRAPCPGYRADEWAQVRSRALAFLDDFGAQAVALGWTAPRLFGVHPEAGIVRVDACGALVLPGARDVRVLTADAIGFGHLVHRTKPGQPEGVPVWRFGR